MQTAVCINEDGRLHQRGRSLASTRTIACINEDGRLHQRGRPSAFTDNIPLFTGNYPSPAYFLLISASL